jgi:BCD family chlorophyll transporter-like MFS transporter
MEAMQHSMLGLGWGAIIRLGLVQASLGAVVVLATSVLNRVMVVELALPAVLPGLLVCLHYLVQISRPRMGHGSDQGQRRTPWILAGMMVLATGGFLGAIGTIWMAHQVALGIAVAVLAFIMIGLGVSAAGTSLLVILAKHVIPARRAPAATIVWMMMIFGFALTAGLAGKFLDPFSPERLLLVTGVVGLVAMSISTLALWGVEPRSALANEGAVSASQAPKVSFGLALKEVWADPIAKRFTQFVFLSMLAYSAQDLILEPFAGTVFHMTPGQSTQLSGVHHSGVLAGMIIVAIAGSRLSGRPWGSLHRWIIAGCIGSAVASGGLMVAGLIGPGWPLEPTVALLGFANGVFSIAAIGSMMRLAAEGIAGREGIRMGLWGASQALAFGLGGFAGSLAADLARALTQDAGLAYGSVFGLQGLCFLGAAMLAMRLASQSIPVPRGQELEPSASPGLIRASWSSR